MNLYQRYVAAKQELDAAKQKLEDIQAELYTAHYDSLDKQEYGKKWSLEDQGYKISVTKKLTPTVDQKMAAEVGLAFKPKYSLDKKQYNLLSLEDKKKVDACLTHKPAKPLFSVEAIDGN